jgi:hypothetical protein
VTQAGPAEQTNSPQRWLKAIHEEYAIGMAMHQPLLDMAMNAASIEDLETSVKNHRFKPKIPVPTDLEERRRQSYPLVMRHFARRRLQRLGAAICKT